MLTASLFAIGLLGALPAGLDDEIPADKKLAMEFLANAEKILQQDPTDGRFGLSRMPGIHGRPAFRVNDPAEKDAADEWKKLTDDFVPAVLSFGLFDEKGTPKRKGFMYSYYHLNHTNFIENQDYFKAERKFSDEVAPAAAKKLFLSGEKTATTEMDYAGRKAMIEMRMVTAPSDKCMSCHEGVSAGKPIGVLTLLRIAKK
ncbi:MAG: hypothetical protein KF836_06645 [Fimbriimonadaceae bacterium]|nr:hypothetical protein [Fimbriimonadaceae bacterium]